MEPNQPGNKKIPHFDHLQDRVIAEHLSSPMLVIKTNLDPENSTENNPYYHQNQAKNPKAFKDFFEE